MNPIDISHTHEIYTITRLNREARLLLEGNFLSLWVEGEMSNFVAAQSGHWYFSLKDASAQIRCAMFKPQNRRLTITPKDGMHIIAKGRVSLYEGRGEFQLLIDFLEDAGIGKLQKEFEALKKRLSEAGLFDAAHKKALPDMPQCIGIITSPTGAAIRDILHVLKRRFQCAPVIIYPTLVQGELAAANIASAIQIANEHKKCDVIILARGGGSIEDLWPFNEEIVAHAIFRSEIPIISGVGHEIDFTIADFVADMRAPTPSAAAELITPEKEELLQSLKKIEQHFIRLFQQNIMQHLQQLNWMMRQLQLQHPKHRLMEQSQQLDLLEASLIRLQLKLLQDKQAKLHTYSAKLTGLTPRHRIRDIQQQLHLFLHRLENRMMLQLQHYQQNFANAAATLDALSPLATLKRGFAIATMAKDGTILRSSKQVVSEDEVKVQLMDGSIVCQVVES